MITIKRDLHHTVEKGEIDNAPVLLDANADLINMTDNKAQTALHLACSLEDTEKGERIVELLLARRGGGADMTKKDMHGATPLQYACQHLNIAVVQLIYMYNGNHGLADYMGKTLLRYAADRVFLDCASPECKRSIIEWLLSNGADPWARCVSLVPACVYHFHTEGAFVPKETMDVFLNHHPDLFSKVLPDGSNFLHAWLQFLRYAKPEHGGFGKKLKYLVVDKKSVLDYTDTLGRNFLHACALWVLVNKMKLNDTLTSFADSLNEMAIGNKMVNAKDHFGRTPGHIILSSCNRNVVGDGALELLYLYKSLMEALALIENLCTDSSMFLCSDNIRNEDKDQCAFKHENSIKISGKYMKMPISKVWESILKSPSIGSNRYQDKLFQDETEQLKADMVCFIERLSERYKQQFPHLAFRPKLRGSIREGTKCGPPDEFDYMLIMEKFSQFCHVEDIITHEAKMSYSGPSLGTTDDFPSDTKRPLLLETIYNKVFANLSTVLMQPDFWEDLPFQMLNLKRTKLGGELSLTFHGELYKHLHIGIDLIPAILLKEHNLQGAALFMDRITRDAWESTDDIDEEKFTGCRYYAIIGNKEYGQRGKGEEENREYLDVASPDLFKVSYTDFEEVMLADLPQTARDAYVITKALIFKYAHWLCERPEMDFFAGFRLTSYAMKMHLLKLGNRQQTRTVHDWLTDIHHSIKKNNR
ncbi:hypothetical protein CAPTEDRAFT_201785 [Capitella teleta]|uniref:Uncharacterized protein n=1 Tax=Capitella teleta TaxID=283909 RepID=R7U4P1_CAPTE|nr:hypothetical protein CAPTEDRAFT_201785 [Capitella teleta]|eukprot:ELU01076.1 hypothetical protein CAPTEDRAFT_201785 [Capitella teleta]